MKHNYPSHRRRPIKHKVSSHRREGHTIKSYSRGKGKHSQKIQRLHKLSQRKRTRVDRQAGAEAFKVKLTYKDKTTETIMVFAPSKDYQKAISEALEERKRQGEMPIEVNLVDPSLKSAIKFIGKGIGKGMRWTSRGVKKAGKIGIKVGKVGAKLGKQTVEFGAGVVKESVALGGRIGSELGQTVVTGIQQADARRLIQDSYSNDKVTRMFARKTLKRRYPELYDQAHFSPAKFRTPLEKLARGEAPKVSKTEERGRKILKKIPRNIQGKDRLKAGLEKVRKVQSNPRASRQTLLNANAVADWMMERIQGFSNPDLGPSEKESVKEQMYKNFDMGRLGVQEVGSLDEAHSKAESAMRSEGYVIDKEDVIHYIGSRYSMKKQRGNQPTGTEEVLSEVN